MVHPPTSPPTPVHSKCQRVLVHSFYSYRAGASPVSNPICVVLEAGVSLVCKNQPLIIDSWGFAGFHFSFRHQTYIPQYSNINYVQTRHSSEVNKSLRAHGARSWIISRLGPRRGSWGKVCENFAPWAQAKSSIILPLGPWRISWGKVFHHSPNRFICRGSGGLS